MISLMISVVPPKFHGIRGFLQELPVAALVGTPGLVSPAAMAKMLRA
jgi:hypothetical protein